MSDQHYSRVDDINRSSETGDGLWRKEIHARVAGYKHRRGRRIEGAFSMRFPFPADDSTVQEKAETAAKTSLIGLPTETSSAAPEPLAELVVRPAFDQAVEPVEVNVPEESLASENFELAAPEVPYAAVPLPAAPRPRARRKVIAFPRKTSVLPESGYVLADPVHAEQPRILDVPEELEAVPATPFLEGLQFQTLSDQRGGTDTRQGQEQLPIAPAQLSRRFTAALLDAFVVVSAGGIFSAVALRLLRDSLTPGKVLLTGAAMAAAVLWSVYEYLFLIHAGQTIGMKVMRLRLSTFKGEPVRRSQRRSRTVALYLSAMSLGMGVLWAFVDLDALCWQDRISGTYLVTQD